MSIKEKFLHNPFAHAFYKWKFYTDLGTKNVSWIVDKLPHIASAGIIISYLGLEFSKTQAIMWTISFFIIIGLTGLFIKYSGLFDVEQKIVNLKNPVMKDIWEASKIILEKEKNGKEKA